MPKPPPAVVLAPAHLTTAPTDTVRGQIPRGTTRRSFLGGALAVSCGTPGILPAGGLFAGGEQRLRVGLVGCGGRGTGAAAQAMAADPTVRVVALGDVFADQVSAAADVLSGTEHGRAGRFDCPPERRFVGPDAYLRVIESDLDVVLLAAPPHVRPRHLEAAVAAGRHVYCEKPVAIDVAGVMRAAAAAARGRAAGLAIVSGFCFRHDDRMSELVGRIHDGAIGRPLSVRAHAAIGLPWRKPAGSGHDRGDRPLRNWISFARFSGGHFVEHHVQAIDRAIWIMGDEPPALAEPLDLPAAAGRRGDGPTDAFGDCPATTAVRYRYADGRSIEASIDRRQQGRDRIFETVIGSAGTGDVVRASIVGRRPWAAGGAAGPGRHA
ncbi:MAG: Gfo/Idh/MocA family protein, partial [Planctomycetia bacterium]